MSNLTTAVPTRKVTTAALWAVQVLLASQFVMAGWMKLSSDPALVDTFAEIGAGQWFRYLVGTLEVAGAIGLLVPRLAGLAALGLTGLMVGAVLTNIVLLDESPLIPAVYLVVAAGIAWARRAQYTRTAK